jgi:hypothetical protein
MKVRTRYRTVAVLSALALVSTAASTLGGSGTASAADRSATAHRAGGKAAGPHGKAPVVRESHIGHGAGEPTLGLTRNGTVYITASSGCVTSCAGSEESLETVAPGGRAVLASKDKGKTWQDVGPGLPQQGISPHVISMDPYLYIDNLPDGDRIFDIDLDIACSQLSYSDDGGASWTTNPLACGEPVNDHQTLFTGKPVTSPTLLYPKIVYYCFNHPAFTKCNKSLNGGLSFIPTTDILGPDGADCSGLNGHGVTDSKGTVYIPIDTCGAPNLAISHDEGSTWTLVRTSKGKANGGDPSVAIDAKGNIYYLYINEDRLPVVVISRDGGKTFGQPINVAAPGVVKTNLATIDVGAPGKVAIAYYGTTSDEKKAFWGGYIAEGVDLLGRKPLFYSASVTPAKNPLKTTGGSAEPCGPGRCGRVLDFIDVEIARDGTPWGAFVDACAAECEKTGVESIHDNEGVVASLQGGPRLDR